MKIIHWEYNEELAGLENKSTPDMSAGCKRISDTNECTGVYFKWRYIVKRGEDVVLHCTAEDSYIVNDIPAYTLDDLYFLALHSYENFKRVFLDRLDLAEIQSIVPVSYHISKEVLIPVLEEMQEN